MTREQAYAAFLDALLQGSRRTVLGVVDAARAGGLDLRTLYLDVFQPALREIGRLWQENRISVADEHLATAITQMAMSRLYDDLFRAGAADGPVLVAACADRERHEVGLRMICDLLECEGWDTVFLGASVPVEDLVAMVALRQPAVVALSAATAPHLERVRETILALRAVEGPRRPVIAVGGRVFSEAPELAVRLGADLTASDAGDAARRLSEMFMQ